MIKQLAGPGVVASTSASGQECETSVLEEWARMGAYGCQVAGCVTETSSGGASTRQSPERADKIAERLVWEAHAAPSPSPPVQAR